ncbi:MAG TPA: ATP-binding protein, partial [Candidatus Dormibacteraeota bacterium]|nr:ATP-binding protein [Candidatus Dormibacteraeota bacterium]
TAGARVAARDPSQALQSFEVIQQTGRDALSELRRALGVLRGAGESIELLPQPGLDQLETLAEQVRQAGVKVEIRISGEPRPLPAGVELSAYRIVQESLTNVLKHGGATHAVVEVAYDAAELLLEICDDGDVQPDAPATAGHGLAGMRERVSMLGGDFQSGSVAGGYYVRATLPIGPQTA